MVDPVVGNRVKATIKGASTEATVLKRMGLRLRLETAGGKSCWAEVRDVTEILRDDDNNDDGGGAAGKRPAAFRLMMPSPGGPPPSPSPSPSPLLSKKAAVLAWLEGQGFEEGDLRSPAFMGDRMRYMTPMERAKDQGETFAYDWLRDNGGLLPGEEEEEEERKKKNNPPADLTPASAPAASPAPDPTPAPVASSPTLAAASTPGEGSPSAEAQEAHRSPPVEQPSPSSSTSSASGARAAAEQQRRQHAAHARRRTERELASACSREVDAAAKADALCDHAAGLDKSLASLVLHELDAADAATLSSG